MSEVISSFLKVQRIINPQVSDVRTFSYPFSIPLPPCQFMEISRKMKAVNPLMLNALFLPKTLNNTLERTLEISALQERSRYSLGYVLQSQTPNSSPTITANLAVSILLSSSTIDLSFKRSISKR